MSKQSTKGEFFLRNLHTATYLFCKHAFCRDGTDPRDCVWTSSHCSYAVDEDTYFGGACDLLQPCDYLLAMDFRCAASKYIHVGITWKCNGEGSVEIN